MIFWQFSTKIIQAAWVPPLKREREREVKNNAVWIQFWVNKLLINLAHGVYKLRLSSNGNHLQSAIQLHAFISHQGSKD